MNMERLKRVIELKNQQKTLETSIDVIKDELKTLEASIIEDFATAGIDKITINGQTIFIQKQIWAKVEDKQKAIDMLKASEYYNHYVYETYNTQQISAVIREYIKNGDEIPKELSDVIGYSETFNVKVTKQT